MLLELPLELAAFGSKTNPYWLRKRKRSHWWSRQNFPKVSLKAWQAIMSPFEGLQGPDTALCEPSQSCCCSLKLRSA